MPLQKIFENEPSPFILLPNMARSHDQSSTREFYSNPPLTLPDPTRPLLPQFDAFLNAQATDRKRHGQLVYGGPYGKLGVTKNPGIEEMKHYLAELPPSISLEARGVFLTTLLDKFNPLALSQSSNLPPFYDYTRDKHLAKRVYGGNGLYTAAEEWVALAKGKHPRVSQKIKLPWLAMHLRHTLLRTPGLKEKHDDLQTAIDLIFHFSPHYRKPREDENNYLDRMSSQYWQAHLALSRLHLIPGQEVPTASPSMRRQAHYLT